MGTAKLETTIRREQIAEAALNIVSASGLKGLSVAAIADKVGLVKSAIYRHFKGKDEVLDALLELIHARLIMNVNAIYEETDDPIERLKRLLTRHIKLIRENKGIPRIVFSEDMYENRPELKTKVYGNIKDYLNEVSDLIRQGQKEGKIRKDAKPSVLSVMFLGLVQPSAILWHLSDGEFNVEEQAREAWKLFHECIRP